MKENLFQRQSIIQPQPCCENDDKQIKINTNKSITWHNIDMVWQRVYVHIAGENFIVLRNHIIHFRARSPYLELSESTILFIKYICTMSYIENPNLCFYTLFTWVEYRARLKRTFCSIFVWMICRTSCLNRTLPNFRLNNILHECWTNFLLGASWVKTMPNLLQPCIRPGVKRKRK